MIKMKAVESNQIPSRGAFPNFVTKDAFLKGLSGFNRQNLLCLAKVTAGVLMAAVVIKTAPATVTATVVAALIVAVTGTFKKIITVLKNWLLKECQALLELGKELLKRLSKECSSRVRELVNTSLSNYADKKVDEVFTNLTQTVESLFSSSESVLSDEPCNKRSQKKLFDSKTVQEKKMHDSYSRKKEERDFDDIWEGMTEFSSLSGSIFGKSRNKEKQLSISSEKMRKAPLDQRSFTVSQETLIKAQGISAQGITATDVPAQSGNRQLDNRLDQAWDAAKIELPQKGLEQSEEVFEDVWKEVSLKRSSILGMQDLKAQQNAFYRIERQVSWLTAMSNG
ncbi:hypothetical protein [Rhabdochlamydiaceae symbiont of Dictyostelium giganteum]|uniref:hypothetical protein n=1 Tax=Rhabdochlamydiaceae symbiont of Dictyostelium giganteum TaxID=3342349 RepID=UPI00384EF86C